MGPEDITASGARGRGRGVGREPGGIASARVTGSSRQAGRF